MTFRIARDGDYLELPAIKGVKRVRYRDLIGRTGWVVEGGINIAYRSTRSTMAIYGSSSSVGYAMV